ncbi:MAG: tetratricopeptide repeat-containing sensor histidine kinase, partial [Bacteroidales bacterium]
MPNKGLKKNSRFYTNNQLIHSAMDLPLLNYKLVSLNSAFKINKWSIVIVSCIIYCIIGHCPMYAVTLPGQNTIDSLKQELTKNQSGQNNIKTLLALSKAYYNESSNDSALTTGKRLLELVGKQGTLIDSAKSFRLVGLIYMQKSWYDKALFNLLQAQQYFGRAGDSAFQATTTMNIGIVHDLMENRSMALSYYEKALKYFKRTKNDKGIADCEQNIAIVFSKQHKYEKACQNLLGAAIIYEKTGANSDLAAAYLNLGITYKKMGDYPNAIEFHDKALTIWKQQDDQLRICYYHLNMGELLLDLKRTEEAGLHLFQAEKLAISLGSKDLEAKAYEYLSDYNAAKKNFAVAYTYLNKSKSLNDSILNAETAEKVNQIQYQYEIVKREVENEHLVKQNLSKELELSKKNLFLYILAGVLLLIVIQVLFLVNKNHIKRVANEKLEKQNDFINSQKNELITLNASKDKFLSILAHDIKNPLSSIFGISELLLSDYDKLTEEEMKVFVKDIHTLADNLYEIINTLLTWSMTQSGMITYHPKNFMVDELCRKSAKTLQAVAKQKEIQIKCESVNEISVLADENMILSVLHNLINNAIKFSFHGSEIIIKTEVVDGKAEISVIDTGIGLSEENQSKIFRYDQHFLNKGTAGESGTGLGLILCKDFVEKNEGKIHVI